MILKNRIAVILLTIFICSCYKPDSVNREELNKYLQDESNGVVKRAQIDNMLLEVSYMPSALVWINDLERQTTAIKVDSLLNTIDNRYYFSVTYSTMNDQKLDPLSLIASNRKLYKEVLANFSFRYGDFVSIKLKDGDVINGSGVIFSKSYGMLPYNTVAFFFEDPRIQEEENIKLVIEDIGFGLSKQRFVFEKKAIKSIPSLKF